MTRIKEILKADARYKEAMSQLENLKSIEDQEERDEAIRKASRLIVAAAYERAEVYELLAFVLIQSADRLLRTSSEILGTVQGSVKYNDKFRLNKTMTSLNSIIDFFEEESSKVHEQYHLHGEVEDSDLTPYDAIEHNAEVILHFNMLIYDALRKSKGNAKILERSLTKLRGEGEPLFTLEEIASI